MFGRAQVDRYKASFADQFIGDDRGPVFRRYQTGAPIRLSEKERDEFIATFAKRLRYALWSVSLATVTLIGLIAWLIPDSDSDAAKGAAWGGVVAIGLLFALFNHWAWSAPVRGLRGRAPEGHALPKEEVRALTFSNITYGQLGLAALIGLVLIWRASSEGDVFHGAGLIWLAFGVVTVILAGCRAFQKWRYDRR